MNKEQVDLALDIIDNYAKNYVKLCSSWEDGALEKMNREFLKSVEDMNLDDKTKFFVSERLKALGVASASKKLGLDYSGTKSEEYWKQCKKEMEQYFGKKTKSKTKAKKSELAKTLFG